MCSRPIDRVSAAGWFSVETRVADSTSSERCYLKLVAVTATIAVAVFGVLRFTPVVQLWRHQQYYGEAESTVDQLRDLTVRLDNINDVSVQRILDTDEFRQLKEREMEIALLPGELVWFQVNEMFAVGLRDDGRILWMTDGVRTSDP